ncbi:MAG: ribosome maturation factor RimM [Gammaproteobacteria bacterium]
MTPPAQAADSARKILIGRFGAPFGTRGWLRIVSFGGGFASFLDNQFWWCAPATCDLSAAEKWRGVQVEETRVLGARFAAKLKDVDDRGEAEKWVNGGIAVARENLPPLTPDGEYYWCDLIGLRALAEDGKTLGKIAGLLRTGAHDVLRIAPEDGGAEILAPFVDEYIAEVDCGAGVIRLHWRREW